MLDLKKSRPVTCRRVIGRTFGEHSTEMSWSAAVRAWTELLEHYRLMSLPFTESANHLCKSARATLLASKTSLVVEMGDLAPASHHIVIIQSNFDNIVKCWQWKGAEQHFLIIFRNQSETLECMEHWGEEGWWLLNSISLLDRSQYVQLCRSQYMCSVQHTMCTTDSSCSSRSHCCTSYTFITTAILKCNRI